MFLTGNLEQLPLFAGIYLALSPYSEFIVWAFILLSDRLQLSISYQIRKDGFKKLQELSFSFYDTSSVGWLLSRFNI